MTGRAALKIQGKGTFRQLLDTLYDFLLPFTHSLGCTPKMKLESRRDLNEFHR